MLVRPKLLELSSAFFIFFDFPEVVNPKNISFFVPNPSICLANMSSKLKSFDTAVRTEVSVVIAKAGKAFLLPLNLWASHTKKIPHNYWQGQDIDGEAR